MKIKGFCAGAFIIVSLLMSSCVSQRAVRILQVDADSVKAVYSNKHQSMYKIQPGDHLYIKVYSIDPKTSKFFQTDFPQLMNGTYLYLNSYMVDDGGGVSFSFIEKLMVKGMTVNEIRDKLQGKLDEYFKECKVIVKLINYQITILGEVHSPGTFTIEKDQVTLFQAIGLASGTTDYGNMKRVKIVRQTAEGFKIFYVDLTKQKILEAEQFYLLPNDVVYIEPRPSKSFAQTQFPYSTVLTGILMVITIATFLK